MKTAVKEYFDGVSKSYDSRSAKGIWAWQRHREARAVLELLGAVTGEASLDLGCGAGFYTRLLLQHGARRVTAVDQSPGMLTALPKDDVHPVLGNSATFTDDDRVSVVVCAGLLEFVGSPLDVLRNARRHAEPGARLICLVPSATLAGRLYRRYHAGHGFSVNLFSSAELADLGARSGWNLTRSRPVFPYGLVVRFDCGSTR